VFSAWFLTTFALVQVGVNWDAVVACVAASKNASGANGLLDAELAEQANLGVHVLPTVRFNVEVSALTKRQLHLRHRRLNLCLPSFFNLTMTGSVPWFSILYGAPGHQHLWCT